MNNTVTFKVAGNDVLSFMDQVRRKSEEVTNDMISNARKQADGSRDQLKVIEDQIKALERKNRIELEANRQVAAQNRDAVKGQNRSEYEQQVSSIKSDKSLNTTARGNKLTDTRLLYEENDASADKGYKDQLSVLREQERQSTLQTKLLKDNIETVKMSSAQQVNQMKKGDGEITDELDKNATPMQQIARDLANEKYNEDKSKGGSGEESVGLFGKLLGVENIKDFTRTIGSITSTQNGFDMIKPAAQGAGQIIGAVIGGIIGSLIEPGGGTAIGAGLGGEFGSSLGGDAGDLAQRRAIAAQDSLSARYKYTATTQSGVPDIPDTTNMGISATEYLTLLRQIAVATGSTSRSIENTNSVIQLEKGVGISSDTTLQFITLFRNTQKDISSLVNGVMNKGKDSIFAGGDYTFLNEFMQKFGTLQKTLMQSSLEVHTGTVFDTMKMFNNVGGPFDLKDFRSEGLRNSINSSLSNPVSDSMSAMSYMVLHHLHPNASLADLNEMREGGLNTPGYLQGMLKQLKRYGGGESFQRNNIEGAFHIPAYAAHYLYNHENAIINGKVGKEDIEKNIGGDFQKMAEDRTTPIEKATADIKNGLLGGWMDSLDKMTSAFKTAMDNAFSGATIEMANGKIKFSGTVVKQNTLKGKDQAVYKKSNETNNIGEMSPQDQALLYSGGR